MIEIYLCMKKCIYCNYIFVYMKNCNVFIQYMVYFFCIDLYYIKYDYIVNSWKINIK